MDINEYIILFGIILILVDIFFKTDIPTFISYVLFTAVFFRVLDVHFMYKIIFSIIFFFALIVFHYLVWSRTVQIIIDKFVSKDKLKVGVDGLTGKSGNVKIIDGNKMACISGELYDFSNSNDLDEGATFTVKSIEEGKIVI